jgi:hypothetical protein
MINSLTPVFLFHLASGANALPWTYQDYRIHGFDKKISNDGMGDSFVPFL